MSRRERVLEEEERYRERVLAGHSESTPEPGLAGIEAEQRRLAHRLERERFALTGPIQIPVPPPPQDHPSVTFHRRQKGMGRRPVKPAGTIMAEIRSDEANRATETRRRNRLARPAESEPAIRSIRTGYFL